LTPREKKKKNVVFDDLMVLGEKEGEKRKKSGKS